MEENNLDVRKLIKFGNSSFVISLPSNWIKFHELKKGDSIYLNENEKKELILTTSKDNRIIKKDIVITTGNKDINVLKREIVSAYINSYNLITIKCNSAHNPVSEIKKVIQNLMALEIVEQTSDTIVAKDFLDIREITINELVRKMDNITRSMIEDLKYSRKKDYSKGILSRDEEVNRLSYLIIRVMYFTLQHPNSVHESNKLTMDKLLNFWDVSLTIESIADDTKRTSREFARIKMSPVQFKKLFEVLSEIEQFYWDSMKSYYSKDVELAYKLSNNKNVLSVKCNELHELFWNKKYVPIVLENFKNIISAIHNIGRRVYS